jgi:hypothetical protein
MNYFSRLNVIKGTTLGMLCLSALLTTATLDFTSSAAQAQGRCEDPTQDPNLDTDGDGESDCEDGCHEDPAKTEPGQCGCGAADTDSDGDLTANCADQCPTDRLQTSEGACGCGVVQRFDVDDNGEPYGCEDPTDFFINSNYVTVRVNRNRTATLSVRPWAGAVDFSYRIDKLQVTPRGSRYRAFRPLATITNVSTGNNVVTIGGLSRGTTYRLVGVYAQGEGRSIPKTIIFRTR